MDLFDGEVTTADKIDRPQQALDREAYKDFMDRNPMAGGGMLVQPGFGGTRQGYATSSVKTKKFKYPVSNQFGTFYSDKKPEVSKAVIKQEEKTKFINQLVSDANAGDKYVSIGEIGEKVKKKFKLKNSKSINITSFPSLELLESRADKIDKVLRDMLISDKPLNGFWHNVISERTGVPINKPGNLRILEQSPTYNSIKDQGLDLLKVNYSRKSFNYLHDFSLSDQLSKALEIAKGNPTYIGLGGEKLRTALPSNKIMEFALRSWNTNKGSKDGPVQFFNQNGKPITWKKGIKLPYKNVSFSYNGKMHKKSDLNTDYMKKFFPEVYNNQIAVNNLSVTKVDNPFKKGSKISVKDLIKKIQVDNYKWSPRFPTLEILHGKKGVATEPFSNLTYATRDINQLENSINASLKAGNIKPAEANKLIKTVRSTISGKTGDDLKQAIIDRQLNLAKQKNLTFPRIKEVGIDDFKKLILNFAGTVTDKCAVNLKADGGRIGYSLGSEACLKIGKEALDDGLLKGFKNKQQVNLAETILRAGGGLKSAFALRNIFGPAAIAATVAFEGGLIGYDMLTSGKTLREAFGDNLLNYALGKDYQIDPQEEMFKRFKGLGYDDQQISNIKRSLDAMNTINTGVNLAKDVGTQQEALEKSRGQPQPFMMDEDQFIADTAGQRAEQNLKDAQERLTAFNQSLEAVDRPGGMKKEDALSEYISSGDYAKGFDLFKKAQKEADIQKLESAGPKFMGSVFPQFEEGRQLDLNTLRSIENPYPRLLRDSGLLGLAEGGRAGYKLGKIVKVKPSKARTDVKSIIDENIKLMKQMKETGEIDEISSDLNQVIKKALDEDLFDKKDRIVDSINISEAKKRRNYPYNMQVQEEPKNLDFYTAIKESNFRTKTGPYFDRIRRARENKAGGGLLKQAGDRSGPPPESGPMSQGLQGLLKRGMKI